MGGGRSLDKISNPETEFENWINARFQNEILNLTLTSLKGVWSLQGHFDNLRHHIVANR
jgi:hypothetical protein